MADQVETRPHFLRNASLLLIGFIIPQVVLLLLNLRGWWLIKDEVNGDRQFTALWVFAAELFLLFINIIIFFRSRRSEKILSPKAILVPLLLHVGYMWFAVASIPMIVPDNIPIWIVSDFNFIAWNVTFIMPGAFISLYLIACRPLKLSKRKDTAYTIITMIALPAVWYFFVSVSQPFFLNRIPVVLNIFVTIVSVVILIGTVLRLFSIIIGWARNTWINSHYIIVPVLCIAAPLGGLYLNRSIPFPADFQSVGVYVVTLLNGLVLFARPGEPFSSARLFVRAMFFPFILYFFLVFLPFLPLSLFAVIIFGFGFLMLTPIALFVFQARIFMEDFHFVTTAFSKKRAMTLTAIGLLIFPGYLSLETLIERHYLHNAIDHIYAPDINQPAVSQTAAEKAAHALLKLRDRKKGIQLPYLGSIYSYIVFGKMVLPDDKLERMYRLLTGEQLPEISADPFRSFYRGRSWNDTAGTLIPPNRNIALASVRTEITGPGKATMRLVMRNQSDDTHSEYFAIINIPEGVFTNGLRLKMDDQFVSGKIFDRKTALWVYKKITEFRQDPALMVYHSPRTIELRVYPFPANGIREVEIDFLFPAESKGILEVDDRKVILNPAGSDTSLYVSGGSVVMFGDINLPKFKRNPYLHFIVDYSKDSGRTVENYINRIMDISRTLGINELRLSAANLRYERLGGGEILKIDDSEKISTLLRNADIGRLGGFWAEMAFRKEMSLCLEELRAGVFNRVPIFVLITGEKMSEFELNAIVSTPLSFVPPDVNKWYLDEKGTLSQRTFESVLAEPVGPPEVLPIVALRKGSATAVFNPEEPLIWEMPGDDRIEYFDFQQKNFGKLNENELSFPGETWEEYAKLWGEWRKAAINPSRLENERIQFLEESRALNVMIPTTSFIVVENTAQMRIMERKEKQSLSNKGALEFEEKQTPEPPEWILLLLVVALTVFFRSRGAVRNGRLKVEN